MNERTFLLSLHELRLPCRLGVSDDERSRPQVVRLNAEVEVACADAHRSDDLNDAVDYRILVKTLQDECRDRSWRLVEKMGFDLGSALLRRAPHASSVRIAIRKNVFPDCEGVTVSQTVRRSDCV